MELMPVDTGIISPATEQQDNDLPLNLASELLATILSNDDEEILVKGNSKKFVYDAEADFRVGKVLKATVSGVKVKQQKSTIEISLTGNIETAEGLQHNCNLYFYMWWDHTQKSPLENHGIQKLKPQTLFIHSDNLSECLADSVFELDLYRKEESQQQEYLGQGRGYLVFRRTN